MSERSSFMPGVCGPNEAIFSPPTEAGRVACLLCIQRVRCLEQTNEIVRTLQFSGYAGMTVIGGEVVAVPMAEDVDSRDQFSPSDLQWNLDSLPSEPDQALIVLRQAYVANRLAIRQRHTTPIFTDQLSEGLNHFWAERISQELTPKRYREALGTIGKQLYFQRCIAGKENKEPTPGERKLMLAVAKQFVEDALAIRRCHIPSYVSAAACHSPEFYSALISYYRKNSQISLRELSRLCGTNPLDPVAAIEARMQEPEPPKTRKNSKIKPVDLNLSASVTELMAQLPHGELMAQPIRALYNGLEADVAERRSISLLRDMITSQADHSDLAFGTRTQLFKRHRGPAISICERYKAALDSLMSISGPGFTPSLMEEFAYIYLEAAVDRAKDYGERYRCLSEACQEAKITLPVNTLRAIAQKDDMLHDMDKLGLRKAFERKKQKQPLEDEEVDSAAFDSVMDTPAALDVAEGINASALVRLSTGQLNALNESEKAANALVCGVSGVEGRPPYAYPQWGSQQVLDFFEVNRAGLKDVVDEARPDNERGQETPEVEEKPLLPYQAIARLSDAEQAAVYIAHCMPWRFTFDQRKAGWADEQRILNLYGIKTRSELIEVVQNKIMPLVRRSIFIPQHLSSEAILRKLSALDNLQ